MTLPLRSVGVSMGALALALALAVVGCHGPGRSREAVLVIGAVLPLSGDDATTGMDLLSGMQLAVRAIASPRVELLPTDGAGEPVASVRRLIQLTADPTVSAVVGGARAATARPMAAVAARDMMPLLILSPMAPPSLRSGPGMHVLHHLESLAIAGAVWARDARAASMAGVFRNSASEASRRLAAAFADEFVARGGEIVWTIDLDDEGRLVPPSGPQDAADVVFVGGEASLAEEIARLSPATAETAYLVTTGWGQDRAPLAGELEVFETAFFWPQEDRPAATRFEQACAATGLEPNADRAAGWDAVHALAMAAIDGGTTRAGLDRALRTGEPIEGVGGRLAIRSGVETPAVFARTADGPRALGRFAARSTAPLP